MEGKPEMSLMSDKCELKKKERRDGCAWWNKWFKKLMQIWRHNEQNTAGWKISRRVKTPWRNRTERTHLHRKIHIISGLCARVIYKNRRCEAVKQPINSTCPTFSACRLLGVLRHQCVELLIPQSTGLKLLFNLQVLFTAESCNLCTRYTLALSV